MIGIIDMGTTNTKLYLLKDEKLVYTMKFSKGIKNFPVNSSSDIETYLTKILQESLSELDIPKEQLRKIILFGMVTSEFGLIEIPHQIMPIGLSKLQEAVYNFKDHSILDSKIEVLLIPGIRLKNGDFSNIEDVLNCDFARGEETLTYGIMEYYNIKEPVGILFLTSHTKFIYVDGAGDIVSTITTLSGQLFDVLYKNTLIGKSIDCNVEEVTGKQINEMLKLAQTSVDRHGFIRSILIPRFMDVFTKLTHCEARAFFEGIIAIEDMKAIKKILVQNPIKRFFIIGQELRGRIYEQILQEQLGKSVKITRPTMNKELEEITVRGATLIVENRRE